MNVKSLTIKTLLFLFAAVLASCSQLVQRPEPPSVSLVSIEPGGQRGLEQLFSVGLRVSNHSSRALGLVGLSYALNLQGVDVLRGSANDLSRIAPYGSEVVNIEVAISILEGLKLINRFANQSDSVIPYQLTVNLDTGLPLLGVVPLVEKGEFDLANLVTQNKRGGGYAL